LLNIGMDKADNAIGFQPSHDSSSYLDMHQSFHKSAKVENIVMAAAR